ncbi:MAG: HAMP domain-containing histidine kinase [Acidobacteria bacterium]|nr:HAMP domain-containing histidine kinase [Acidobacteriota bacterium]MBV9477484.1 HAMP domain-containing histidine kinase [Acidobacteriota bacterium]
MEPWLEHFAHANFRRSADTAHDLKTPLNVAVLNLELLRMRLRKLLGGEEDDKVNGYTQAIDLELRRMGRIFDAFFLLSTPPRNEGLPVPLDIASIAAGAASSAGVALEFDGPVMIDAHEARIRQAMKLFFEGATKLFAADGLRASAEHDATRFSVAIAGTPEPADFEVTKIFKFYYTDPSGNPDLSLAVARLVAETYGGGLNAVEESDKVTLRLSLPLGAR